MSIIFNTTYHLPENTPYEQIIPVQVQVDDLHRYEAAKALKAGAPILTDFVKKGISEGWIKVLEQ